MATLPSLPAIEAAFERLVLAGVLTATERRLLQLVVQAGPAFALRGEMILVPVPALQLALWDDSVDAPSIIDVERALSRLLRKSISLELPRGRVTCTPLIQVVSGANRQHFFGTWLSVPMREYLVSA